MQGGGLPYAGFFPCQHKIFASVYSLGQLCFLRRKMTNAHGRTTAAVQARPVLPSSCSQPLGARDAILSDLTHSQEQRTAAVYVSLAPLRSPLPISSSLSSPPIARPLLSALLCCLRRMLCFEQQKKRKKNRLQDSFIRAGKSERLLYHSGHERYQHKQNT